MLVLQKIYAQNKCDKTTNASSLQFDWRNDRQTIPTSLQQVYALQSQNNASPTFAIKPIKKAISVAKHQPATTQGDSPYFRHTSAIPTAHQPTPDHATSESTTEAMNAFVTSPLPPLTRQSQRTCSRQRPHHAWKMASGDEGEATNGIQYGRIQHAGVLVQDTEKSKKFYMEVLGMSDDTALRNDQLPFRGAFVRAGSSQIHLMELPNPDPLTGRPVHGGRDRHFAVTVSNINSLADSLQKHGREYTMSKSGRRALFTRDLDANALEFIEDASV